MSYTDPVPMAQPDINLPWIQGLYGMSFGTDMSKRMATCRKCKGPIPAGSQRKFVIFNHSFKKMSDRGGSGRTKMYFHPDCLSFDHDERDRRSCANCNGPKPDTVHGTSIGYCIPCLLNPRLMSCHYCDTFTDVSRLSPVIMEDSDPFGWSDSKPYEEPDEPYQCCVMCEKYMEVVTKRTLQRIERKERAMMKRVRDMKRDIESWDYD